MLPTGFPLDIRSFGCVRRGRMRGGAGVAEILRVDEDGDKAQARTRMAVRMPAQGEREDSEDGRPK
ncbi:MAG: hypothetical protein JWP63_1579 [Candidatus Solibacter sp.]|nr:hypothetical protein [Candidatus Solibacter sp.]